MGFHFEAQVSAVVKASLARLGLSAEEREPKTTWLELRVTWNGTQTAGTRPTLVLPTGVNATPPQRGFDDWRIQEFGPASGFYTLTLEGEGEYTLQIRVLRLQEPKGTGMTHLPDLVTLVPIDIAFGPCDQVETFEQGAKRCLRLANGVGNIGDGPLEVHLTFDRALFALTPITEGRFTQRLYQNDGTHKEHDVGPATLHLSHGHWHYASLAHFALYAYDTETGLRGEEVAAHHKQGFCFLDWGKMESPDVESGGGSNAEQQCLVPNTDGWSMGVSKGFYDFYGAELTDQYVDAAGVGEGTYELVSMADGQHSLAELDESNNAASVVIELRKGKVTVVEERGHYYPKEYRRGAQQ